MVKSCDENEDAKARGAAHDPSRLSAGGMAGTS